MELYEKYHAKGLEIIGISRDRDVADLTAYVKAKGIPWWQVHGPATDLLTDEWGIEGLPTVFLIDRQGRLHSMNARGKLEKWVPELLGLK